MARCDIQLETLEGRPNLVCQAHRQVAPCGRDGQPARVIIAQYALPMPLGLVPSLLKTAGRYCKRHRYTNPVIVTAGPDYRSDMITVAAYQEEEAR